jgi:hypothetical protein
LSCAWRHYFFVVVVVESHFDSLCNAIVHEIMGKPLVDSEVQN